MEGSRESVLKGSLNMQDMDRPLRNSDASKGMRRIQLRPE